MFFGFKTLFLQNSFAHEIDEKMAKDLEELKESFRAADKENSGSLNRPGNKYFMRKSFVRKYCLQR